MSIVIHNLPTNLPTETREVVAELKRDYVEEFAAGTHCILYFAEGVPAELSKRLELVTQRGALVVVLTWALRLHAALDAFEGVDVFKISDNGRNVFVRFDGPAHEAYVFAELNRQRLTPKGVGLTLHKQRGLKT